MERIKWVRNSEAATNKDDVMDETQRVELERTTAGGVRYAMLHASTTGQRLIDLAKIGK